MNEFASKDGAIRLIHGDGREVAKTLEGVDALLCDPPYGMDYELNSKRFSGGNRDRIGNRGDGLDDWPKVAGDDEPFDPAPWLDYPRVILWGSSNFAPRLPEGPAVTLIWIKKFPHLFGTFLSDAEVAWFKKRGSKDHGVFCFLKQFPPPSRMRENNGRKCAHPMQKPVDLMRWCLERAGVKPGMLVFDPYAGSATIGLACIRHGCRYVGVELERQYFETGVDRLRRELGRNLLFE